MPRKAAPAIELDCQVCGTKFEARDTKRGRERKTCGKSCASKLAYKSQASNAPCVHCGIIVDTAKSVINAGLPIYCNECAKARYKNECAICGAEFMAKRAYVQCCSQRCIDRLNESNTTRVECAHCGESFDGLLVMCTQASAHSVQLDAGITGIVLKTLAGMAAPGRAGYALSGTVTITNACAAVAKTG